MSCMRSTVGVWLSACTIRFRKASLSLLILDIYDPPKLGGVLLCCFEF